ncbi:MAG: hypothetical protein GX661_02645, partial [Acholeplasmataceae bacterium]|nr:hypothetical protein [Acholeplasmataceae bacterium]
GDEIYPFEEYLGPDRDHLPSLSTAVGYYNVNIDNPVSVEEIKNALQAFDDVDGDLSAAIEVITDNYTSKRTCPGIYEIVFRATDQSQNSTDFIVYVKVQDLTPPVITGPNYIKTSPLSPLSISDLYNQLQYSDNSNKEVDISVESNNYTNNSGYIGLYSVIFSATDLSGNKSYLEMTIDVKDEDSPVIFGPTEFYKAAHETIELSEMLAGITAYDEYCQDVTDSIRIISDGYSLNAYKPGSWPVYIEACDYYGNVANFTFYVNVHDAKGPLFLIDTNLITIVLEDDPPSLEMVLESLSEGKDFEYQTIVDEYTGNEKRPGRYRVVVRAESEMREFEINVQGEETPPKLSFWQKIGNFFRELFRKIWGIFN